MANRIFLDTNIVADLIDDDRVNHLKSIEFLEYLILTNCEICISEDMITTLFYISKDKKSSLAFFKNVIYKDWKVMMFGQKLLKQATDISLIESLDLEDVLQCLCAKENGCSALITNDKKFYNCGIDILSIEEFKKTK